MLFVGRLVPDKGVFELLDALSVVRRSHACRLTIAGEGPAAAAVACRVALLGLAESVDLLGYVSGVALDRAYRGADIFVLPSYREGFPLVVMEAMAYGLPIVTTPIRGCADHLAPGVNALFAPPRDVEALAERLTQLLGDSALRRRMGAANVEKVQDFAPEAVIPRYAEILRSVAATRGARWFDA
jgi:glycosyltransferase involved in cell wall biosynthesis